MTRLVCLILAIVLLLAGIGVSAEQYVLLFDPAIASERQPAVLAGAMVLKVLLCADALLLLALAGGLGQLLLRSRSEGLWNPSADGHAGDSMGPYLLLAAAVLLLATVLRSIGLDTDLWMDEVFTLVNFVRLPPGELVTDFTDDNQHLFYSLLAHFSIRGFGESAWALRMPAVLAGIASVWASMRLARLVFDKRVALLTGLLLALSWHHIWFSQNARGYTLLLLGTVLSTELLMRGIWRGRWRYWIGYAVVIALAAWAHITAVFVALAHGLVIVALLVLQQRPLRMFAMPISGFLLAAWTTLHLYAMVLPQMVVFFSLPGGGSDVTDVEWRNPLWLFNEIFRSAGIDMALGWASMTLLMVLVLLCAYWYLRREPVFVWLAFLPGVLLGATMFMLGRNLWPRMFFNEAGFIIMLLVTGMLATTGWLRLRFAQGLPEWVSIVPVLLLCVVFASSLGGLYRLPKQDFSGARDYVLEHMEPRDKVVGLHVTGQVYNQYYADEWAVVNSLHELEQQRVAGGHTWVLYALPNYIESVMPDLARVIEDEFDLLQVFPGTLGDGSIYVRRSK